MAATSGVEDAPRTHSYNIAHAVDGMAVLAGFVAAAAAAELRGDATMADLLEAAYRDGRRDGYRAALDSR